MATSPVKFYLDENLSPKILKQLRMRNTVSFVFRVD